MNQLKVENSANLLSPIVSTRLNDLDRQRLQRVCQEHYLSTGAFLRQQVLKVLNSEEKRLGLSPLK